MGLHRMDSVTIKVTSTMKAEMADDAKALGINTSGFIRQLYLAYKQAQQDKTIETRIRKAKETR